MCAQTQLAGNTQAGPKTTFQFPFPPKSRDNLRIVGQSKTELEGLTWSSRAETYLNSQLLPVFVVYGDVLFQGFGGTRRRSGRGCWRFTSSGRCRSCGPRWARYFLTGTYFPFGFSLLCLKREGGNDKKCKTQQTNKPEEISMQRLKESEEVGR